VSYASGFPTGPNYRYTYIVSPPSALVAFSVSDSKPAVSYLYKPVSLSVTSRMLGFQQDALSLI
jgi:hypothetical protein